MHGLLMTWVLEYKAMKGISLVNLVRTYGIRLSIYVGSGNHVLTRDMASKLKP